jgi:hypothetical protein
MVPRIGLVVFHAIVSTLRLVITLLHKLIILICLGATDFGQSPQFMQLMLEHKSEVENGFQFCISIITASF